MGAQALFADLRRLVFQPVVEERRDCLVFVAAILLHDVLFITLPDRELSYRFSR